MKNGNNNVRLVGDVVTTPELDHELYGEKFYSFNLQIFRESKYADIIPIIVSERSLTGNLDEQVRICIEGSLRSRIKYEENGQYHLHLYVFVDEIYQSDEVYTNNINLCGFLSKEPIYRTTPLGREIIDLFLAVQRQRYNKSDYIPCIAWGRKARFMNNFPTGTKIELNGRIQSRTYTNQKEEQRTVLEVSVTTLEIV